MEFPAPEYVQFYPTTRCNQRCSFCFNQEGCRPSDMQAGKAIALLDILKENSIHTVDIMGGEPFLLPWIMDFIGRGLSMGFSLNISTNGSSPAVLERLRGVPAGSLSIGVSLEGSTAGRHNRITASRHFGSAMESISLLTGLSLDPVVKTVLTRETAGDIQNIVELVRRAGVRRYRLLHMDILSKKGPELNRAYPYTAFIDFYRKVKKANPDIEVGRVNASCFDRKSLPANARCAGGVRKLSIMPDGSVFPCNLFHSAEGFCLGNIFRDRFTDIWSHPKLGFFRTYRENSCGNDACTNRAECTGGCPAHGSYHHGNPDAGDVRCGLPPFSRAATDNPRL